ncbi:MAG: hypothetical protein AAFN11_01390, partial [Chloroflexota bacterium]
IIVSSSKLLLTIMGGLLITTPNLSLSAQDSDPISMVVEAGYDNFYRPNAWVPIKIDVRNEGAPINGRLTVRPETSGRAVAAAYSAPIDLPTGSEKTAFLYIEVAETASSVLVELIDGENVRVLEQRVGLTVINSRDSLNVVISGTGASTVPLSNVAQGGYFARPARLEVGGLPPHAAALNAIDTLVLYDVQTDQFTVDQLRAIEGWVATGGHLVTIGGPSWAQTASGLDDALLPFVPIGSETVDDITALAQFIGLPDTLTERTFVTTGDIVEGAQVLATTDDDLPLLVRREFGAGISDFLTVDPTLEPLRSWTNMPMLWFNIFATAPPQPGWTGGFVDSQEIARALAILPNVDLLPPVSSMILFIAAYIILIGPVNYLVLSRIRKRAWGWGTIPLFITAFTLIAWNVGFNLRGSEIIVSRLYITQSYLGTDVAYQDQLVGVLSPRRELYTITAPQDALFNVLPGLDEETVFSSSVQRTTAEVTQDTQFSVQELPIDGGIFANFSTSTLTTQPDISGSVTISYDTEAETTANAPLPIGQNVIGVIRNDSDITLEDAIVVLRNQFYPLDAPLAPGDVVDFSADDFVPIITDQDDLFAMPSPFQMSSQLDIQRTTVTRDTIAESLVTSRVLLGIPWVSSIHLPANFDFNNEPDEEQNRRRALLRAFMRDQYASRGIGNQAYLMGWTTGEQPTDIAVQDVTYRAVDTSLHIIELASSVDTPPASQQVTIDPSQFTWAFTNITTTQVFGGVNNLTIINPGFAEMQLMPLEGAVLDTVDMMTLELDRSSAYGREVEVSLWNYQTNEWDAFDSRTSESYDITAPEPYLGPRNTVRLRLSLDRNLAESSASARIGDIRIIQIGNF